VRDNVNHPEARNNMSPLEDLEKPRLEKHYRPSELAQVFGVSDKTVQRMFQDEPGVLFFGRRETTRRGRKFLRRYATMRIPQSAVDRLLSRSVNRAVPGRVMSVGLDGLGAQGRHVS
jgi:AraC-like DNA-binding protein